MLKKNDKKFPFEWADRTSYRDSDAFRKEIYLKENDSANTIEKLIALFYSLFGNTVRNLIIYNESWWDFCLDTWNIEQDRYNYDMGDKSGETKEYLKILIESQIPQPYSGGCNCEDWNRFLAIILECLLNHKAPYSPLFCDVNNKYFFYFHYTGSIGLYFKEENEVIAQLLKIAYENYNVND